MEQSDKRIRFIKAVYWVGIIADAFWAVILLFPSLYFRITGMQGAAPDLQMRLIMAIGGMLMLGWTVLLFWAKKEPIERRGLILITAFPVLFGLAIVAFVGYLNGGLINLLFFIKAIVLLIAATTSYIFARKIAAERQAR